LKTLCLAALSTGLAAAASFTYNDFSSVAGLSLNGTAAQVGNVLHVVPNTPSLAGDAFNTSAVPLDGLTAFHTMFEFNVTTDTGNPTDGFSFILQNDGAGAGALGGGGQGSGYVNLSPSVAVLFRGRAPSFIGVILNGVDPLPGIPPIPPEFAQFNEGDFYNQNEFAWIDYDPVAQALNVYLSTTPDRPASPVLTSTVDLFGTVGSQAFVGFGAGTGGASGDNDILSWDFQSVEAPEPGAGVLVMAGVVGLIAFRRRAANRA
jgi:Legume lectin domain